MISFFLLKIYCTQFLLLLSILVCIHLYLNCSRKGIWILLANFSITFYVLSSNINSPSGSVYIRGQNVEHFGTINANGKSGGKVQILSKNSLNIDGSILAKGQTDKGGNVYMVSENQITSSTFVKTNIDVAGKENGGTIRSLAERRIISSGSLKANSESKYGGKIDLTAKSVKLVGSNIEAKGKIRGGKVRIGGII